MSHRENADRVAELIEERDDPDAVRELMEQLNVGANDMTTRGTSFRTRDKEQVLWLWAVKTSRLLVLRYLLSRPEIDVNILDPWLERTALKLSCIRGEPQLVELLLQHHNLDPNKSCALHSCQKVTGHYADDHRRCLQLLLEDPRTNVNMTNEWSNTFLMQAVGNGWVDIIKMLLAHPKIDVNIRDRRGQPALVHSLYHRPWESTREMKLRTIKLLLDDDRVVYSYRSKHGKSFRDLIRNNRAKELFDAAVERRKKIVMHKQQIRLLHKMNFPAGLVDTHLDPFLRPEV